MEPTTYCKYVQYIILSNCCSNEKETNQQYHCNDERGFTTVTTQHPSASYHSSNETNITAVASQQLGSSHQPR